MNIDFRNKSHIIFFAGILPLLSVGLAWFFYQLFPNPPFLIDTISPLFAYGLFYSIFEKHSWCWKIFKIFGITPFPDLNGRWKGKQISSHKENGDNVILPAYLEVTQTFSNICIRIYYQKSESESWITCFSEINGSEYLFYIYDCDPNSLKAGTMQNHKGTVKLKYLGKENKLIGTYFNSIGNQGDMVFEFEQQKLLYRFNK